MINLHMNYNPHGQETLQVKSHEEILLRFQQYIRA